MQFRYQASSGVNAENEHFIKIGLVEKLTDNRIPETCEIIFGPFDTHSHMEAMRFSLMRIFQEMPPSVTESIFYSEERQAAKLFAKWCEVNAEIRESGGSCLH